jgi:esterase/lipase superfamily enzyme
VAERQGFLVRMFCAAIAALVAFGVTPSAFAEPDQTAATEPVDVFYITNRAPETAQDGTLTYGAERSHSMAFGRVPVFGHQAETAVVGTPVELGRFPVTPYALERTKGGVHRAPAVVAQHEKAAAAMLKELGRRVEASGRKEIVVFVHGFNNSFDDAVKSTAQLCSDFGPRDFTCIALTWPAGGSRGAFLGYNVDRESGEFSVSDVMKALRIVSDTPGLREWHFIAHSRGTDVLSSALKDLSIESYVSETPMSKRRAGNIIFAAPDMDLDVAFSKLFSPVSDPDLKYGHKPAPDVTLNPGRLHLTVYASDSDGALGMSEFLYGSQLRLGRLDAHSNPDAMRLAPHFADLADFISVEGGEGLIGHSYFLSNPRVRADMTALVRDHKKVGDHQRPLTEIHRPFWYLSHH